MVGIIKQSEDDLREQFQSQINLLVQGSVNYDKGHIDEAKRLAVTLRLMLHDTDASSSLLKLLNKKNISFYDTGVPYNPNQKGAGTMGLVMLNLNNEAIFSPLLDDGPPEFCNGQKIPFESWWVKALVKDENNKEFSRRDFILGVANKDGGAHVDLYLSDAYYGLKKNNLGWKNYKNGQREEFKIGLLWATIRQISHEVLKSFKDEFPQFFSDYNYFDKDGKYKKQEEKLEGFTFLPA